MGSRYLRAAARRLDRGVYALFSRHADRPRHERDRDRYRGAALSVGFETYLARIYGLSWLLGGTVGLAVPVLGSVLSPAFPDAFRWFLSAAMPGNGTLPPLSDASLLLAGGLVVGASAKRSTIVLGTTYLRWRARARRAAIERSLPGAVRYLRVLADGSENREGMIRTVADRDAYGGTAEAFDRVLETAALTGSLDTGLRRVARDTPSRALLAPFLLKFREHANQGTESLQGYLRMESRMLSHRQSRARQRAGDYLEIVAKLFVVFLVVPASVVVAVTVLGVLAPGLSKPIPVPAPLSVPGLGTPTIRTLLVYGGSAFVLVVGASTAAAVARFRPSGHVRRYERPTGYATVLTALSNPASAAFVFAFPAVVVTWGLWAAGEPPANAVLLGYAAYGLPVGTVAVSRARLDDAKDREIRDFVHAIAGHVDLGQPFEVAVETVADEVNFGPLQEDVDDLAFRLGLTTGSAEVDTRREALGRFVARVGTPLAEQTVGLVTGALAAGSDTETTFETLQTEVGSLYHQRKRLQSAMFVYVAVGWATAVFVILSVVAVERFVLVWLAGGPTVPGIGSGTVDPGREGRLLYLVTQTTVLACGWFAGVAARGRYTALLHSSSLVVICYLCFVGAGAV
jgi:archaellum biogenesis protein FlaJ (TadC family)